MIAKDSWINLPVGSNLIDHLNVSTLFQYQFQHTDHN